MKRFLPLILALFLLLPLPCFAEEEIPALYPIRENDLWGYMNRAGETVIEPQWDWAEAFNGDTAIVVTAGDEYEFGTGLIRRVGSFAVPSEYAAIQFCGSFYLIRDKMSYTEALFGWYDTASGFFQEPVYVDVDHESTDSNLIFAVWSKDGDRYFGVQAAFFNRDSGMPAISIEYSGWSGFFSGFHDGYALWMKATDDGFTGSLIDTRGNAVVFPDGIYPIDAVCEGLVCVSDGTLYGLARPDGNVILYPCYDSVNPAYEGRVFFTKDGKTGILDTEGNVVLPPVLDIDPENIFPDNDKNAFFHNGYALLHLRDGNFGYSYVFMDRDGNTVFSMPIQTDGSASFAICSHAMGNGLVWYSLTKVSNNGERASAYGLLRLSKDGCEYLTEPMFEEISVPDSGFGNFSEGLSPVKLNGSWGYIDETAQWVIPPQYDDASSFRDGLALVEKDGKLMYIDHSGAVVWKER